MAKPASIEVWNPNENYRVISTKPMPGTRWINLLIEQDCRVEICTQKKTTLSVEDIIALIGDKCNGVIKQNIQAVGYNNVDVSAAATKYDVAVGSTPNHGIIDDRWYDSMDLKTKPMKRALVFSIRCEKELGISITDP